jgi:hypothetical protein
MELQEKARELWEDFVANHSIDPQTYYEGSFLQRQDELFFYPALSESFDWLSKSARKEHINLMDSLIESSAEDTLAAVEEWRDLADMAGIEMDQVHATIAEYLPQIINRSKALASYRNQMMDLFAEAAAQASASQPLTVNGVSVAV